MIRRKRALDIHEVSRIFEVKDADGSGMLGFTVTHSDGYFDNVILAFVSEDYETIRQKGEKLRQEKLSLLPQKDDPHPGRTPR